MTTLTALSIVTPHGGNIASGRKTLEVRSWRPDKLPLLDLAIVENGRFLREDGDSDPDGRLVALVDVHVVEPWRPDQVDAACASGWVPGYHAWHLENVRPVAEPPVVPAQRRLYRIGLSVPPVADET